MTAQPPCPAATCPRRTCDPDTCICHLCSCPTCLDRRGRTLEPANEIADRIRRRLARDPRSLHYGTDAAVDPQAQTQLPLSDLEPDAA